MASLPVPETPPNEAKTPQGARAPQSCGELNVLCYTLLGLFVITFTVWLVFTWTGYGKRYSQSVDYWSRGNKRTLELTVIPEDEQNLGCASDLVIEGMHCANRADKQPFGAGPPDDRVVLRNYVTTDHQLFLGAGLWSSPKLQRPLPSQRFTLVCDFHMVQSIKSVSLRWSPGGAFTPVTQSIPAGRLVNCEIPP
jgi:hypothetical protein